MPPCGARRVNGAGRRLKRAGSGRMGKTCRQWAGGCDWRVVTLVLLLVALSAGTARGRNAAVSAPLLSAEERAWLDDNPDKLVLWYNTDFPPVEYADKNGEFAGMGAEVIALLETSLAIRFDKRASSDWNEHLRALESGECAVAPTIVRTEERERFAFFTTPYATVPVVIITADNSVGGLTLDSLAGRRVGVVSGYATERYLSELSQGRFTLHRVKTVVEGLHNLSFRGLDAFVENLAVAAYHIDREGIPNLRVAGRTDYVFAWSIGVSRKYPLLYSALHKALERLPPGEIEEVRRRFISLGPGLSAETRLFLQAGAIFAVLLVAGLALISLLLKRRLDEKVAVLARAQEEVQRSEARFRQIFDNAPFAAVINDFADGRYLDANQAFLASCGITRERLPQLDPRQIHGTGDEERQQVLDTLAREGVVRNREATLHRPDGSRAHMMYSSVLLDIPGRRQVLSMTVDITDRKEMEEALRRSEEKIRSLFAALKDVILIVDRDGRYLEIAPTDATLLYRPPQELLGKTVEDVFPAELARSFKAEVEAVLDRRRTRTFDYPLTIAGREVWFSAIVAPLSDDRVIWIARDITESKQLHGQLLQSQKMEAIGILAGGVAHDFNNMLGAIIGYSELCLASLEEGHPLREKLGRILDAAQRSAGLTRQLLAFARKQAVAPVLLDLNAAVEGTLKMLQRLIGENIDLQWCPQLPSATVKIDPSQLDQLLANLCVNAKDAVGEIGRVTIETGRAVLDKEYCATHAGFRPGDFAVLAVSDNGVGMNSEVLSHIFEPFFTTKGLGRGTGLGLATVYGIVKQNDGFINVYSEPGRGTTIRMYLPRQESPGDRPAARPGDELPLGRGERVLLVEDDPTLLDMTTIMLDQLGYQVLSAAGPGQALTLAAAGEEIDLYLTDVVMPEMNGRELARRLAELRPGCRGVFMSGYTSNVIIHNGVLDDGVFFLQKPFSLQDLALTLHRALGGEAA